MKATEALYEGLFPKPYKVILIFKSGYEIRGMWPFMVKPLSGTFMRCYLAAEGRRTINVRVSG